MNHKITKIYCAGAEHYINQMDFVRLGFRQLGVEIVSSPEEAELIYCNDPTTFSDSFRQKNTNAKIIYTILDIPPHLIDFRKYDITRYPYIHNEKRDFCVEKLKQQLASADIVASISKDVSWQLDHWCGIKNSPVIYNPVKPVQFLNLKDSEKIINPVTKKPYKYLYVGRANDINKRFYLIKQLLYVLGEDPCQTLAVVGTENPGFGHYYGVITHEALNKFYNSVEYFLFPTAYKSIGLPALESVITQTKTVVCDDDPASDEFWPGIGVSSNPLIMANQISSPEWNAKCEQFVKEHSAIYCNKFSPVSIAKNILNLVE